MTMMNREIKGTPPLPPEPFTSTELNNIFRRVGPTPKKPGKLKRVVTAEDPDP
jgi:hypothetical protein